MPIDPPKPFLEALATGRQIDISAAADSFSTDLDGTGPLVDQLLRGCGGP